ncbi:ATP-binding cassette domain-containing protein [Mycobacterium sp. E796]|uniref:ATP-binding cassette domain-containing protein n=1 Tax=Mycobacterium sp. E796 TaxID=1834151 RepID=UPI0007FF5710|nr:ATP-binding cassette domain-containing protein [Mycobacterium sp. E796]OBI41088.1 ABC transporter [Mycobacterium sp. E796]
MRPEASAFPAPPLTVWVGPTRYVFAPGRDVLVGYGPGVDIPLGPPGHQAPPHPDVVLRFTGRHWVAIDNSPRGMFVNGSRVPTVDVHSGQAITIGDPQRGPRLVFQIDSPAPPPPVTRNRPNDPSLRAPTERGTQPIPIPPPQPPAAEPPRPPAPPEPPAPPLVEANAAAADEPSDGPGLIERMTTRKLPTAGPSFRTQEGNTTYRLPLRSGARTSGVTAYQLGLTVDGHEVLTDISFTAAVGTLTAIVGPSTARNSALLELLAGTRGLSSGTITVDGHDVHAEPESMRSRIGIVRGDECLHPRLTVEQALGYAAELRLPPDTAAEHRRRVVDQVLEELELAPHRATRISKLPPELRRCASLAVELVTRPTLLVVDDPGAGLDAPQQDRVMAILRRQADIGCVVVVAMPSHSSLSNLNLCDQVLVLTARGAPAFLGTPLQVESAMGSTDWATVLEQVGADPDGAHRAFRARQPPPTAPPQVAAPWPLPEKLATKRQVRLLVRRQLRLLFADHLYFLFLAILPFVLAALALLIPGDSGLERPNPSSSNPHEAIEILAALNIAAVIVGTALTIRTLVEERRPFRREQALGLSTPAYLGAKIVVFGLAALILSGIVFAIVVAVKGGPVHGPVLLGFSGGATAELYLSVGVTAVVSAVVGLALSAMGSRLREVLPLLVLVILASLLFNGSLVQLVSKWGFQQVSWFVPAQWGFAASASVADLRRVDALAANALMWTHYSGWWIFDMVMLLGFGAGAAGFALYRLRAPKRPT